MTDIEKLRAEIAALDTDPDAKDLLHRLMQKVIGQNEAYRQLQTAHDRVIEKHDRYRAERNDARFKEKAVLTIMVDILAQAQTAPWSDTAFRSYVITKLKPLAHALGHTYMEEEKTK